MTTTCVSLITEFDEADLEIRLADDINFARQQWGIEPASIQFSAPSVEGHGLFCVLVVYHVPEDEAQS